MTAQLRKDARIEPGQWTSYNVSDIQVWKDTTKDGVFYASVPFTWTGKGKMIDSRRMCVVIELGEGVTNPGKHLYRISSVWNANR